MPCLPFSMHGPFKSYMKLFNTTSSLSLSHLFPMPLVLQPSHCFPHMWSMPSEVEQDGSAEDVCVTICKDSVHSTPTVSCTTTLHIRAAASAKEQASRRPVVRTDKNVIGCACILSSTLLLHRSWDGTDNMTQTLLDFPCQHWMLEKSKQTRQAQKHILFLVLLLVL